VTSYTTIYDTVFDSLKGNVTPSVLAAYNDEDIDLPVVVLPAPENTLVKDKFDAVSRSDFSNTYTVEVELFVDTIEEYNLYAQEIVETVPDRVEGYTLRNESTLYSAIIADDRQVHQCTVQLEYRNG